MQSGGAGNFIYPRTFDDVIVESSILRSLQHSLHDLNTVIEGSGHD